MTTPQGTAGSAADSSGPLRLTFGRWHNKRVVGNDPHDGAH